MADIWIEKKPKAKRGPHRGKVRYKVRYREFSTDGIRKTSTEIFTTRSAAEKYKEELLDGGKPREKLTMFELADDFIKIECSPNRRKEATARDYKSIIRNHIKRHIGEIKVKCLTVRDVQLMQDAIMVDPIRRKGLHKTKAPGPRAANKALMVTKMLLRYAEQNGIISGSPILGLKPIRHKTRPGVALSESELERLLRAAKEPYRTLIMIAVNTGMRLGELLGLDWSDISLRKRTISLRRQFTQREVKDTLKTEASHRVVPMNDAVFARLNEMRVRADLSNWVFPGKGDNPLCGQNVLRQGLRPGLKKAGLDLDIRFHDLRHTAASRMAKRGISAIAAGKVLGHNSLSMTELYSHPDEEMTREAVEGLWESERIGDNVAEISSPVPSPITAEEHLTS